jgi:hypothetical protein
MVQISKIIIFFLMMTYTSMYASNSEQKYGIESATIEYVITGGGCLTPETNLTVKGQGKLHFKEWGQVELFEEAVKETTSGAIKNIETTQVCKKIIHDKKLDVDFKNKKILERQIPNGNYVSITKGLVQKGQKEIAGYRCDVWEAEGVKKCIYKGIPLLVAYDVLGISYQKSVASIIFDTNNSLNQCTIPSYPVQKFALFKTNIKTKSKKLPKEFSKRLMEISKAFQKMLTENNMTQKDISLQKRKIWLEKIGENIFQKQKAFLPEFLLGMKKARVCLQQAQNGMKADRCFKNIIGRDEQTVKSKQSGVELWGEEEKQKVLDRYDADILRLESKMKCIRSTKNITDLSSCMK